MNSYAKVPKVCPHCRLQVGTDYTNDRETRERGFVEEPHDNVGTCVDCLEKEIGILEQQVQHVSAMIGAMRCKAEELKAASANGLSLPPPRRLVVPGRGHH